MKNLIVALIGVYAVLGLATCVSSDTAVADGSMTLDQAIEEAARDIEANVQAGKRIAVLNFTSPTEYFSSYVVDELSDRLVNGRKLIVVDRKELDLIRQEEQFQMSGEVSDESAQAIGKKLGAQIIASGSITPTGATYRFRIRTLNVESAAIETSLSSDIRSGETKVVSLLRSIGSGVNTSVQPSDFYGTWVLNDTTINISSESFSVSWGSNSYTISQLAWTAIANTSGMNDDYQYGYRITGIVIKSTASSFSVGEKLDFSQFLHTNKRSFWGDKSSESVIFYKQ